MDPGVEQAIREAVVGYLTADDDIGSAIGPIRDMARIAGEVEAPLLTTVEQTPTIQTLEVTEIAGEIATAELDATVAYDVTIHDGRHRRSTRRFTGPVELVKESGTWKVADLLADGRSVRDAVFRSDLVGGTRGVRVAVLGGYVLRGGLRLYVDVDNQLGAPLALHRIATGIRARGRWRWHRTVTAVRELPPGPTRLEIDAARGSANDAPAAIRLLLDTGSGLVEALPAAAVRRRRWFPLFVRFPQLPAVLVALACAAFFWFAFDEFGGAGVSFAVVGSILLIPLARQSKGRLWAKPYRRWAIVPVSLFVVGLALLVLDHFAPRHRDYEVTHDLGGIGFVLLIVGVAALAFDARRLRRGGWRRPASLGTLAFLVVGSILFFTQGGLHENRLRAERRHVEEYVADELGPARIRSIDHVDAVRSGGCTYDVWDVRTSGRGYWVVTGDLIDEYPQDTVPTSSDAVRRYLKMRRLVPELRC